MKIPVDKHERLALAHRITSIRQRAIRAEAAQLLAYAKQLADEADRIIKAPAKEAARIAAKDRRNARLVVEAEKARILNARRAAVRAELDAESAAQRVKDDIQRDLDYVASAAQREAEQKKALQDAKDRCDKIEAQRIAGITYIAASMVVIAANLPRVPASNSQADAAKFQIDAIQHEDCTADVVIGRDDGVLNWMVFDKHFTAGCVQRVTTEFLMRMMNYDRVMLVEQVQR